MDRIAFLYLLPFILSLLLSLGIFLYSWGHRRVLGVGAYTWFAGGQTLTTLGFILELINPTLAGKVFWDKFQWLTTFYLIILPFLIFVVQFTEYEFRKPRLIWATVHVILGIFTLILLTDDVHHLIYPNPKLSSDQPFPELTYDFTFVIYLYAVLYVYIANIYGISLLVRRWLQSEGFFRRQYAAVTIGFLIPLILSLFSLAGIRITAQRDNAPIALAIGNLIVAWGLFRYEIFEIAPLAREQLVENMKDPVFVLDAKNRVVEVNQAALGLLGTERSQIVGRNSRDVFENWPLLRSELDFLDVYHQEIPLRNGEDTFFYDINISSVFDRNKRLRGRIVVARDITRHKTLESGYRLLSQELEQRVRERTEELRKSAEQYRAVVENQTEFIVRWKAGGVRTFVNEAYCRYFEIRLEDALSTSFIKHIAEEDQPAVGEKMARLTSGVVSIETDIHRVIKPDGSIGWQEWTDQSIRDESGQILEFQSVGRDITERKRAEESLLHELAFDELVTSLLTRFATSAYNELDLNIETALAEISSFMGAEECDILVLSEDKTNWEKTHSWSAPHLASIKRPNSNIPTGKLTWSENRLLKGRTIRISTLDDYPPEAQTDREYSEAEGAKSLISVPIRGKGPMVYGCIDLISYVHTIDWTDSDVTHLKILGDVIANTLERKRAEEDLVEAYDTTLEGWAKALEFRDKETEGHSRRVTDTTLAVATAMGLSEEELVHIRRGSILHDIGKMAIPDDVLRKPGPLTAEERAIVMKHPQAAYDLLVRIPHLKPALAIPYSHHEKWDGSGYPQGLRGEAIPLAARIFTVVDVWDALHSARPYRPPWDREKIMQYFMEESGKYFDPEIVEIFLGLIREGKI